MKSVYLFIFLFILTACASAPKLLIRSNIPARIEKNGTTVCESTPCEITGMHYRDGYDWGCVRGKDTPLEAFSLEPNAGVRQAKVVRGECEQVVDVFFEMSSGQVINTISQGKIDQTITNKLEELSDLKKRGLISDSEYKIKRKEILDNYK